MKKIAYITGTRADFGLMTPVLIAIKKSKSLNLELFITGEHLIKKLGNTSENVKKYFPNAKFINSVLKDDSRRSIAYFATDFFKKAVDALYQSKPDLVLILGDRPEMLATAFACLYLGIPTAHIHGGDKTNTVDEVARHAITKLSSIHFAATRESAERIIKMGEDRWRVHTVGAPALDTILNERLPTRAELFKSIDLKVTQKYILLTLHPDSSEINKAGKNTRAVIMAIKKFRMSVAVIYPHTDAGGNKIIAEIEKEKKNKLFRLLKSLDHKLFLALEREAAVWVGNSSAAMIESASFRTPVVNVGKRQLGRQRGKNVIDVPFERKKIEKAIFKALFDKKYLRQLSQIKNPWGDGKTSRRIVSVLEKLKITSTLLNKQISY